MEKKTSVRGKGPPHVYFIHGGGRGGGEHLNLPPPASAHGKECEIGLEIDRGRGGG